MAIVIYIFEFIYNSVFFLNGKRKILYQTKENNSEYNTQLPKRAEKATTTGKAPRNRKQRHHPKKKNWTETERKTEPQNLL